jgi:hypothetical protein
MILPVTHLFFKMDIAAPSLASGARGGRSARLLAVPPKLEDHPFSPNTCEGCAALRDEETPREDKHDIVITRVPNQHFFLITFKPLTRAKYSVELSRSMTSRATEMNGFIYVFQQNRHRAREGRIRKRSTNIRPFIL